MKYTFQYHTDHPDDVRVLTHLAEIADFESGIEVDQHLLSSVIYFLEILKDKVVDGNIHDTTRHMFGVDGKLSQEKWDSLFAATDNLRTYYVQALEYAKEHTNYLK